MIGSGGGEVVRSSTKKKHEKIRSKENSVDSFGCFLCVVTFVFEFDSVLFSFF